MPINAISVSRSTSLKYALLRPTYCIESLAAFDKLTFPCGMVCAFDKFNRAVWLDEARV